MAAFPFLGTTGMMGSNLPPAGARNEQLKILAKATLDFMKKKKRGQVQTPSQFMVGLPTLGA